MCVCVCVRALQATREQLTKVRVARLHPHARRLFVVIVERTQKFDLDPRGFVEPTRIGYKESRVVRVWRPVESQRDLARRGCGHVATSSLRRNDPDQVRRVCVLSLRKAPRLAATADKQLGLLSVCRAHELSESRELVFVFKGYSPCRSLSARSPPFAHGHPRARVCATFHARTHKCTRVHMAHNMLTYWNRKGATCIYMYKYTERQTDRDRQTDRQAHTHIVYTMSPSTVHLLMSAAGASTRCSRLRAWQARIS